MKLARRSIDGSKRSRSSGYGKRQGSEPDVLDMCKRYAAPSRAWTIELVSGKRTGTYCTKGCAERDAWWSTSHGSKAVKAVSARSS